MYKYCVKTEYLMIRDLSEPLWRHKYLTDYTEQKYFKTKAEMKKELTKEARFVKEWLGARREKIGNCHEIVAVYEKGRLRRSICIRNRFLNTDHDFVLIRCIELNPEKDGG